MKIFLKIFHFDTRGRIYTDWLGFNPEMLEYEVQDDMTRGVSQVKKRCSDTFSQGQYGS